MLRVDTVNKRHVSFDVRILVFFVTVAYHVGIYISIHSIQLSVRERCRSLIERWFANSTDKVVTCFLKQRPLNPLPNAPTLFVTRKHCMIKHLPIPTSNHQKHHISHSHYFRRPTYAKTVKVTSHPDNANPRISVIPETFSIPST